VCDDLLEPLFGGQATGTVEDAADGAGDFGALSQARDVGLGVLLEVKLAALPRDGPKDGLPQRLTVMNPKNQLKIQWPKVEFTVAQLVKLNPSFCELTLRVMVDKGLKAGTLRQLNPIASKKGRPRSLFIFTDALT